MSGPTNPRGRPRYSVPVTGSIGPVQRSILDEAKAYVGGLALRAGHNLDLANTAMTLALRGPDASADVSKYLPAGELTGLTSGGSGLVDSANGLPLVRMDRGLMSLQADPRVIDAAGLALPAAGFSGKVAKDVVQAVPGAVAQAGREFLEAGATGTRIWAGPKSKTWRADDAAKYVKGENVDFTPEGGWQETGTTRVKDGSLIQEIDDSKAALKLDHAWGTQTLEQVLDHPEFRAAYPDIMRDYTVELEVYPQPNGRKGWGEHNADKKRIKVVANDMDEARSILLHEVNHAVGRAEGRATGGSPDSAGRLVQAALSDPTTSPELRAKLKEVAYDDYGAYRRLQDEALSRAVQRRADYGPGTRERVSPQSDFDIPEQDWIVSRANEPGISMSYLPEDQFTPVQPKDFDAMLDRARQAMIAAGEKRSALQVDAALPKGFRGKAFMTPDGMHGFAVDANGNIINLFKHPDSPHSDVMGSALRRAQAEGGSTLQAFDTGLAEGYKKRGAIEVGRSPFNPDYAPEGWDPATMGTPDYVEMALGPTSRPVTKREVRTLTQSEPDIGSSLISSMGGKQAAKAEPAVLDDVLAAIKRRGEYRKEADVTPGPNATDAEWADWGKKHGVNLTVTTPKEVAPGISIPGGFDGEFTIADYFHMKANPFNPRDLGDAGHEALMQKIIRTLGEAKDPVDVFNRLVFSQMSPNAPLLQNGALASRARVRSIEELRDLANGTGDVVDQLGLGAAGKGGMGLRGTPDPNEIRALARFVLENPDATKMANGETTRDIALRLMNNVPLFSQKTASLGAPTLDMARGTTSAVDLHVIRNNWRSIMRDPEVGPEFVAQLAKKFKVEPTYEAIEAAYDKHPGKGLEVVRSIVERKAGGTTKLKSGKLNKRVPEAILSPSLGGKLPEKFQDFGKLYDRFSKELTREHIGNLPEFANQWAKWDGYRGRFEPHEFLHPDYKRLPKMGFSEFQRAYKANVAAGYTGEGLPKGAGSWKDLYYGQATPDLLALLAAGGAGAAALFPLLADGEK